MTVTRSRHRISEALLICCVTAFSPLSALSAEPVSGACEALDARALAVEARLPGMATVSGSMIMGDTVSVWRGYFDGGALVHLVEHQARGARGEADAWYWLEDGRLFRYEELDRRHEASNPDTAQTVETRLWFGPEGQVIQADQVCDGVDVVPVKHEVHAAVHHGSLLQAEAVMAFRARRNDALFFCHGNEPFWSAEIIGSRLRYRTPDARARVFIGSGEYKDADRTLYEWRGRAPGDVASLVGWVQREACADSMADHEFPWRGALRMPGGEPRLSGCCDTRPPPALLSRLDAPAHEAYACAEGALDVWFLRRGATALVLLDGEQHGLERVPSASGVRYTDGRLVLLRKGDEALLDLDEQRLFHDCQRHP